MVAAFQWLQKYCVLVTVLCNVEQIWSWGGCETVHPCW